MFQNNLFPIVQAQEQVFDQMMHAINVIYVICVVIYLSSVSVYNLNKRKRRKFTLSNAKGMKILTLTA